MWELVMVSCFCRSGWFLKVSSIVPWCRVQSNRSVCQKANIGWGEEEWKQLLGVCVCVCVCVFVRQKTTGDRYVCVILLFLVNCQNIWNSVVNIDLICICWNLSNWSSGMVSRSNHGPAVSDFEPYQDMKTIVFFRRIKRMWILRVC